MFRAVSCELRSSHWQHKHRDYIRVNIYVLLWFSCPIQIFVCRSVSFGPPYINSFWVVINKCNSGVITLDFLNTHLCIQKSYKKSGRGGNTFLSQFNKLGSNDGNSMCELKTLPPIYIAVIFITYTLSQFLNYFQ